MSSATEDDQRREEGCASNQAPPLPQAAPASPWHSLSDSPRLSSMRIRLASLHLSEEWIDINNLMIPTPAPRISDTPLPKVVLAARKEEKDDGETPEGGEMLQLAFFPLLAGTTENEEAKTTAVVELVEAEERKEHEDRTVSSEASVGGSLFSVHTAGGIWEDVPMGPPDAILGIAQAYRACTEPNKVNVAVGAYRDENGKPWVLPSVRAAEKKLWDEGEFKEYLPIEGDLDFVNVAMKFAYGPEIDMAHIAAVQTLSGTGACRVGGVFLNQFWGRHPIYVPDPTWGNHIAIFKNAGLKVLQYRYYDKSRNCLDLQGMLADIDKAPNGSIILLHACAHNPTGCDPTIEEWKEIISLISEKEHVAFFDSAYQGFASGDAEMDAQPFRYAVSQHVPILLAQSFAKNFGLYGERVGTLSIVCGDAMQKERILSELRLIIRSMYSSPPRHGSSIVKTILMDDKLKPQYYEECASMAKRIQSMRLRLVQALVEAGSTHDWSHITRQIGMFAYTGLSEDMCRLLTDKYYIFLTLNGRISVAGLNESNVDYVAKAIHEVSDGESITA